ncbi:MAG: peptidylprolyl isomerase [Bacteriovoracaceae bacterium]|nr:peptidylprolyl isomerase [Bacteriovoracaceae bacterium]
MQVEEKKVVSIHYKLTDDDGNILDSSENAQPLVFIHGIGMLIPGLEKALEGKVKGDKLNVSVKPEDGYGERDEGLTQMVPKTQFDDTETIQIGMQFQVETEQGVLVVTVTKVTDDEVKIDGNHPLAGVNLNFDVSVEEIREATQEELDHGHVHGAGGHDH